jgi:hypothetical protein
MKRKKEEDLSWLNECQKIYVLNKKYSKFHLEFVIDTEDDWFIYVVERTKKTKQPTFYHMIIRKDMPSWLSYRLRNGWELIENNEESIKFTE